MQLPLISSLFHHFKVFCGYAGKKLYFLCIVVSFGGIGKQIADDYERLG